MTSLTHQHILLGITGGIAAYKSADLIRKLKEKGAKVKVVMTDAAKSFITPLTLQTLSGEPVYSELLDEQAEYAMNHIALARWADWILVAPASADFIARLTYGHADDLLTTLCLATSAKIILAPAMNRLMWENIATQNNVALLQQRGIHLFGPDAGEQACGETGLGRMTEPNNLVEQLIALTHSGILAGKRVLITAGPTYEPIDPVRYIANKSSGKMGYALAAAAKEAGADTCLISGPVNLPCPPGITYESVETAEQMLANVMEKIAEIDIFIAAAAVADYRVKQVAKQKIKKTSDTFDLHLVKNPDILAEVTALPKPPFTVGFAAETCDVAITAKAKQITKKVDILLANDVSNPAVGFQVDYNEIIALWENGKKVFPLATKTQLAKQLILFIKEKYDEKNSTQNSG